MDHRDQELLSLNGRNSSLFGYKFEANFSNMSLLHNFTEDATMWMIGSIDYSTSLTPTLIWLQKYYIPAVILVGLLGNIYTVFALQMTRLCHNPTTPYLTGLAISDGTFVLVLLLLWLQGVGLDVHNRPGWCQFFTLLSQMAGFMSPWYVFSFVLQRLIVLRGSSLSKLFGSLMFNKVLTSIIAVLALVIFLNISLTVGLVPDRGRNICMPLLQFVNALRILDHLDVILNCVSLEVAVIIMICLTVVHLRQILTSRRSMVHVQCNSDVPLRHHRWNCRAELKLTKALIAMSCVFVLFTLPTQMMRVLYTVETFRQGFFLPDPMFISLQKLSYIVTNSRFCINIFLYLATMTEFRKAFKYLIRKIVRCRIKRKTPVQDFQLHALHMTALDATMGILFK